MESTFAMASTNGHGPRPCVASYRTAFALRWHHCHRGDMEDAVGTTGVIFLVQLFKMPTGFRDSELLGHTSTFVAGQENFSLAPRQHHEQ
ncbi:hypothetical protein CDD82_5024 [Ophiocordyceps australis]|uniref:Uncharacterized protein n=1 Tax=Ophiocordyceps australis TaxID=1399860 RepID=A0A2C5Z503_9HYPO|nr:hypothetical protein CDD82_5024 [Ophiocordyceps australis]